MADARKKLEQANKLIFVKQYDQAEEVLDSIVATKEGHGDLLVHIRRIELAAMLKKLDRLRDRYVREADSFADPLVARLCVALTEQHGEFVSHSESMTVFQDVIKNGGPAAPAYYGIASGLEAQGAHDRAIFNYEQSLSSDPDWYLSYFGLSQIYYQLGDDTKGDHFFYLFEQAAPFNVYGNFETHRRLYHEFLQNEEYEAAEAAIHSLAEWWQENRGRCPKEIEIYELMAVAKISEVRGRRKDSEAKRQKARLMAESILEDAEARESVLFFVAKVMEEFDEFDTAYAYYRSILQQEGGNPALVQRIGSQFLSMGEYDHARDLFEEGYRANPDNPDIRFCLLVAQLKQRGVNVEEYLIGRERLRQLLDNSGDKVELLALLHSLMAKFDNDPDVHGHLADVYLKLGNIERAERHYRTMYEIDGLHQAAVLKYAAFEMQYRDPAYAMDILATLPKDDELPAQTQAEVYWLKANYYSRQNKYRESLDLLEKVLALDPWNVSYITQKLVNLAQIAPIDEEMKAPDAVLADLNVKDEAALDWSDFDERTASLAAQNVYDLVYTRLKLRFLYDNGSSRMMSDLVQAAVRFDASQCAFEFMKLLNTNFDGPDIYWALGTLYKELWQLETAGMWFDQMLRYPGLSSSRRAEAYIQLADTYIWRQQHLDKAVEFAKLATDISDRKNEAALRILAHAYLKTGQVRQAIVYVEQLSDSQEPEVRYLKGLIHYRNGSRLKANEVWKPLLTHRADSLRFHHIKQEVLRYYFEGEPYLKAN